VTSIAPIWTNFDMAQGTPFRLSSLGWWKALTTARVKARRRVSGLESMEEVVSSNLTRSTKPLKGRLFESFGIRR